MQASIQKVQILIEALPYIRSFYGKTVVVKYGGAAMSEGVVKEAVAQDLVLMRYVGMYPVVVHGGGPQIGEAMKQAGLTPQFIQGLRVTDHETMKIVEMVLVGSINQEIVALINRHGGKAVGISGRDGGLIGAQKHLLKKKSEKGTEEVIDLGLVGEVVSVDPLVVKALESGGFIPIIAPTGAGRDGQVYNLNADVVAGEVAAALGAEKLVLMTDVDGITDKAGKLIPTLTKKEVQQLIKNGTISSGMLPKVESCLKALEGGVKKTHVINGKTPHALLLEIFTEKGIGTEIVV
jgi:acetylglutamate kinase